MSKKIKMFSFQVPSYYLAKLGDDLICDIFYYPAIIGISVGDYIVFNDENFVPRFAYEVVKVGQVDVMQSVLIYMKLGDLSVVS